MTRNINDIETVYKIILSAARELFSHFGFKKTAVDDIAKKAMVAKGTVYNYFKSKEDIFQKVFNNEGENMLLIMKNAVDNADTPQNKLREMLISKIKFYNNFYLIHEAKKMNSGKLLPIIRKEQNNIIKKETQMIRDILSKGVENSVFNVKNIDITAKALAVAIKGLEVGWSIDMDYNEAVDEIDTLLPLLFKGLEIRI